MLICWPCFVVRPAFMMKRAGDIRPSFITRVVGSALRTPSLSAARSDGIDDPLKTRIAVDGGKARILAKPCNPLVTVAHRTVEPLDRRGCVAHEGVELGGVERGWKGHAQELERILVHRGAGVVALTLRRQQ